VTTASRRNSVLGACLLLAIFSCKGEDLARDPSKESPGPSVPSDKPPGSTEGPAPAARTAGDSKPVKGEEMALSTESRSTSEQRLGSGTGMEEPVRNLVDKREAMPPGESAVIIAARSPFLPSLVEAWFATHRLPLSARAPLHLNDEAARERLGFLSRDFKTTAFDRASAVNAIDILPNQASAPFHISGIEMVFGSCPDLQKASEVVHASGRQNFLNKLLTVFRVVERDHSLIFIFTESALNDAAMALLEYSSSLAPESAPCKEAGQR